MISTAAILVVLAIAASLGSCVLSQWRGGARRVTGTAIVLGGTGIVCLIGAAALSVVGLSWWQPLRLPLVELSAPMVAPAAAATSMPTEPLAAGRIGNRLAGPLQRAVSAMQAHDWSRALVHLQDAQAVPERTAYEDYKLADFFMYVHLQMRNYPAAALALERQLAWDGIEPAERIRLLQTGAQLHFQLQRYDQAGAFARQYLDVRPGDVSMRNLLAQADYLAGWYVQAEEEIEKAMAANLSLGHDVPLDWVTMKLSAAARAGDQEYRNLIYQSLSQNYPQYRNGLPRGSVPAERLLVISPSDTLPVGAVLPPSVVVSEPLLEEWPATECVVSMRAGSTDPWMLSNQCRGPVAIVMAWCQDTQAACTVNAMRSQAWSYEPAGIVLANTGPPLPAQRWTDDGPAIGRAYALRAPGDQRRRIRYLACKVTEAQAASLLEPWREQRSSAEHARLQDVLLTDKCYARVLQWSAAGARSGVSPDALVRDGLAAHSRTL
jgi:tetratricopeptide (TPR) repeat protein